MEEKKWRKKKWRRKNRCAKWTLIGGADLAGIVFVKSQLSPLYNDRKRSTTFKIYVLNLFFVLYFQFKAVLRNG